jgi:signal transduction histidine kinase
MASSGRIPPERGAELTGKVAHTAQRLGQSLTDIVAALREGGDRLDALLDYLAERGGALMPDERPRLEMRPPATWPAETMSLAARRAVQLIALEAMHNAVRHAGATRVEVGAAVDGRRWRLWIEDDGVGIGAGAAPRPGGGQGQGMMRKRAAAIRAELTIGPGAGGRGTRVEIVFEPDATERTT